ncbi:MAG TPA: trypsin-like peptidase domain-containing protein [Burkholderiaceae bacterium]
MPARADTLRIRRWALVALLMAGAPSVLVLARDLPKVESRAVTPRAPLPPSELSLVELFQNTAPSVAYITTEILQPTGFFTATVAKGAGSGFVWDDNGHVVTNNHVVEGARNVFVQLDAGEPVEARIVGTAPDYDLAVVKLTRSPRNLRPIPLGTSRDLRIGQSVYAIGNPYGLQRTLTHGIVSALGRELPTTEFREVAGVIQTDTAINPGNSGGPLLDSAGRLIGVNTAIRSESGSSAGIGFAIPADLVNRVVPSLISRGRAPLPGIGINPVRPDLVERAGITGVVIDEVPRGTPAAQAGLKPLNRENGRLGDIIIAVNGRAVDTVSSFVVELDKAGIGSTVDLTVMRDEKKRHVKVQIIDVGQ